MTWWHDWIDHDVRAEARLHMIGLELKLEAGFTLSAREQYSLRCLRAIEDWFERRLAQRRDSMADKTYILMIWTIFDSPEDYPGQFVARKFTLDRPTDDVVTGTTLDEVRRKVQAAMPYVLTRIDRDVSDHASVVESWL